MNISSFLPAGYTPDDFYIALTATAAFILSWSLGSTYFERDKLGPRLAAIQQRRQEIKAAYLAPQKRHGVETPPDWMKLLVSKLAILKDNQIGKISTLLTQAGYRSKDVVVIYAFCKLVLPFIGLAIGLLVAKIDWDDPFSMRGLGQWLIVIGCAYAGARLQDLLIHNKKQKRYHAIRLALPDTLDLMLICAEAGLSLAATLDRVARELGQAYPEMCEELGLTSVEIGFLPERATALRNLIKRVDIKEVRGIVNVLLQTEKYGTPVAQALRVLSKEFRTERMLRAEQKAARLPALMTIPLIVFILPTLFIIILTPAVIGILDGLG